MKANNIKIHYVMVSVGLIITVNHFLCFNKFGATYWYDSIVYFDMSYSIFSKEGLAGFYEGARNYLYQHIGVGTPLLWGILYVIFGKYAWQAYAFFQHAVAALALFYFLLALRSHLHPLIIILAALILTLHPFYESFHNSVMTESIASSMLLFLAGAALYLVSEDKIHRNHLSLFITAGMIGTQFRPQLFLFAAAFLLGIVLIRKFYARWIFFFAGSIILASLFLFPFIRWIVTGKFFLPNTDYLSVSLTLYSNASQSEDIKALLSAQDFPAGIDASAVASKGLSYNDSIRWISHLKGKGYSEHDTRNIIKNVARKIKFGNWENISSQLDSALAGVGLLGISFFHSNEDIFSEGMTTEQWRSHYKRHFNWLTWTSADDYGITLDDFLKRYSDSGFYHPEAIRWMKDAIRPNVSPSEKGRDPLGLVKFGSDIWVYGWLAGMIAFIALSKKEISAIFATVLVVNYILMLVVGFGNIRYSYVIFPFNVIATCAGIIYTARYVGEKLARPLRAAGYGNG